MPKQKQIDITLPEIGDFANVPVIEVLVKPGDRIVKDASLVTLESDKATMEIPSTHAGLVKAVHVKLGDRLSSGARLVTLEVDGTDEESEPAGGRKTASAKGAAAVAAPDPAPSGEEVRTEVVVLGAGPGGYTAAFRAADLGRKVVLIEREVNLGGVCLNVGCIPSKALLHVAQVVHETHEMGAQGVVFDAPRIDIETLRGWKDGVVKKLTGGLAQLAKRRKVEVIRGEARFASPHTLAVRTADGERSVRFEHCIVAAGSRPVVLPGFPEDPRIIDSTGALALTDVPQRLLVIGGGIIGLEMATVYHALGTKVSVVELQDQLIPGCDPDLVRVLSKRIGKQYEAVWLSTRVTGVTAHADGIEVRFEGMKAPASARFDRVLVAVGRRPNGDAIGAEAAGLAVDERGYIAVDRECRTNVAHIHAIGDITGNPMLAHRASHMGKVAAEVIAGHPSGFDPLTIPSVAYTDPEVAWMGTSEAEAKAQGIEYDKASFPWAASGRALSMGREDGLTKLIFEKNTKRVLGAGIVGVNAGELIAEAVLALEMGADLEDLSLTIHAHPTLSETLAFAAEMGEGTITDLYVPKTR